MNLFEIIKKNAKQNPEKMALIYQRVQYSYKDLIRLSENLASSLLNQGVKEGDHIALFLNNSPEFAFVLLACAKIGVAVAPFPLSLKGKARTLLLKNLQCKFVIGWHTIINQLIDHGQYRAGNLISFGKNIKDIASLEESLKYDQVPNKWPLITAEKFFILTMTSGSTGDPKPIIFSQKTKINRALDATRDIYGLSKQDIILTSTPLYHSLAQRSLLLPLMLGGTSILLDKFTPALWLNAVCNEGVTFMFTVSNQLDILLPELRKSVFDFSNLHTLISSSALLRNETKEEILKYLDCEIHECYGASEVGVVTSFSITKEKNKRGSVGRPLHFVDLKIQKENGEEAKQGEIGEITCKTTTRFEGYFNNPEAMEKAIDDKGYFHTGDLGFLDQQGYLFFKGRNKDVIISGGINIYPKDIESIINEFEGVNTSAAVGKFDEKLCEVIVVFLEVENRENFSLLGLKMECINELIDYQIPRDFIILEELPKTGLGKIQKQALKRIASKRDY